LRDQGKLLAVQLQGVSDLDLDRLGKSLGDAPGRHLLQCRPVHSGNWCGVTLERVVARVQGKPAIGREDVGDGAFPRKGGATDPEDLTEFVHRVTLPCGNRANTFAPDAKV
jgi:hypothetical protein